MKYDGQPAPAISDDNLSNHVTRLEDVGGRLGVLRDDMNALADRLFGQEPECNEKSGGVEAVPSGTLSECYTAADRLSVITSQLDLALKRLSKL